MPDISLLQREYEMAQEESRMPSVAFTVSIIFFLVFVVAYAGLYAYSSFLKGDIESVSKQMNELKVGDAFKNIDQLNALGARIKVLKSLRESHTSVRRTLVQIEGVTHPSVSFLKGKFDLALGTVRLQGIAPTPNVLLRQVELYQADKNISDFKMENPSYGEKHSVILNVELTTRK